ncbi:hypothetical protein J7E24_10075 [Hymenobacter sp. ISL-91]|uniref:hypothetical protein n=1 Tax=Hymenobacter sp. ISL-91 TaxID=2819151 RepID=UPI001BE62440|nr:hypothetical protein [Hymenobacter sp. ISL-91]MBT2558131.1 hypothetical protein [Hymenobacter sp. ISL-91]
MHSLPTSVAPAPVGAGCYYRAVALYAVAPGWAVVREQREPGGSCYQQTAVARYHTGEAAHQQAQFLNKLAALQARAEALYARPLFAEPFMQPLLAACAALAAASTLNQ